jgi:hypothetical protein
MPRGRKPEGEIALSSAERQARYRARRHTPPTPMALGPQTPADRPPPSRVQASRAKRWRDAVATLIATQAEYAAWLDAMPESLRDGATAQALQDMVDLDLEEIAAITPPRGYGRD